MALILVPYWLLADIRTKICVCIFTFRLSLPSSHLKLIFSNLITINFNNNVKSSANLTVIIYFFILSIIML